MASSNVRHPVVAGTFYNSSAEKLKNQMATLFTPPATAQVDAIGCVLPHAGYAYSGSTAAKTIKHLKPKEKIILIGPNHTGQGESFSIMSEGAWQTPFGEVPIDHELAQRMLFHSGYLKHDYLAHQSEHSLEVELPLLQHAFTHFQIVPIAVLSSDLAALKACGSEIADTIVQMNVKSKTLIVASTDMTHYEPQESAHKKDKYALDAIAALDETLLYKVVHKHHISMCGWAPVVIMLSAAKSLGAQSVQLVDYRTSADATRQFDSVVGYAGLIIY